jgi:branched-chain amino acid transport system permease protein
MDPAELLQQTIDALSLGSTYALLALGLALVFSIMGLINFAHGELMTVSGYAMFAMTLAGLPALVIVPLTVVVATLAAVSMERIAFRPVRGASGTTMLLTSFAVSIILQNIFLMFISARPKAIAFPQWTNEVLTLGRYRISVLQLLTMAVTLSCLLGLGIFLRRTTVGVGMRAASQDFDAARLMGLRANQVVGLAFAISGALAGVATLLYLARRGTVDPFMGLIPVLKAFIASVLGGLGSLIGAVVGGFLLGGIEAFLQALLPESLRPFRDAAAFGLVILVLLFKPQGLLGGKASE